MHYPEKKPKASAREVIRKITKQSNPVAVAEAVDAALFAQWQNARDYQELKKRTFVLSYSEFLSLITSSRRHRMEKAMASGNFERFMKSRYGYVLGWKSRKAFQAGIMSVETAAYLNREDSERSTQFGPGDQHSDESKDLIRKARTGKKATDATKAKMSKSKVGVKRDEETKKAISDGLKGKSKTPEQKAKIAAAVKARLAEKKAAKEREQQWAENNPTKPAVEFPKQNEASNTPTTPSDGLEKRNAERNCHQNIAKQLQRGNGPVGRGFVLKPYDALMSAQA